jgi:hypothetical protein
MEADSLTAFQNTRNMVVRLNRGMTGFDCEGYVVTVSEKCEVSTLKIVDHEIRQERLTGTHQRSRHPENGGVTMISQA